MSHATHTDQSPLSVCGASAQTAINHWASHPARRARSELCEAALADRRPPAPWLRACPGSSGERACWLGVASNARPARLAPPLVPRLTPVIASPTSAEPARPARRRPRHGWRRLPPLPAAVDDSCLAASCRNLQPVPAPAAAGGHCRALLLLEIILLHALRGACESAVVCSSPASSRSPAR